MTQGVERWAPPRSRRSVVGRLLHRGRHVVRPGVTVTAGQLAAPAVVAVVRLRTCVYIARIPLGEDLPP